LVLDFEFKNKSEQKFRANVLHRFPFGNIEQFTPLQSLANSYSLDEIESSSTDTVNEQVSIVDKRRCRLQLERSGPQFSWRPFCLLQFP